MADELKDQRVVTMMSPSELKAIDDWMFENRIRSRGEAIRRLCQIGLSFGAVADKLTGAVDRYLDTQDAIIDQGFGLLKRVDEGEAVSKEEWVSGLVGITQGLSDAISPVVDDLLDPLAESSMLKAGGKFEYIHKKVEEMRQDARDAEMRDMIDAMVPRTDPKTDE